MSKNYSLAEETLGYNTALDETNADTRLLSTGSQNVLIDRNAKVKIRPGLERLGSGSSDNTSTRNGFTWNTSTATELGFKFYDDEWEVYFQTVDGIEINDWKRLIDSMSTTAIPRGATWWDNTENIDLMLFVQGDDNIYEWNGAVCVVDSVTANTITKKGTSTFAQNRFYTTRNKTLVNPRTGNEHTYTGGETTTTLTGLNNTTDIIDGDILVQKVVTNSNQPVADRNNHTIFAFENQICVGSDEDNEVYISKNDDFTDYTFSAPRIAGEGAILTLDSPAKAFGTLGEFLVVSAGRSSWFRANYEQITVSTTLAETLAVKKMASGVDQGALNQETLVQLGDSIIYLSHESAVRMITNPQELEGLSPRTLSNPIKPDFDAEDWTNACAEWHKNSYYLSAPASSKLYVLDYIEDADGDLKRFWNPPQIMPVRAMSVINEELVGYSNSTPEVNRLFVGTSDYIANATIGEPGDKIPVKAIAAFAYNTYGDRAVLKNFDEYFVEGEITPNTKDLLLTLNYGFGGSVQEITRTIDGSDEDILQGHVGFNSLGQKSLGVQPLGGLLNPPSDSRKYNVTFEMAKEDFRILQAIFSTNEVDRYWAVAAHGANVERSRRKNIKHYK